MKLLSILSLTLGVTSVVTALPYIQPVENTQFDIRDKIGDNLESFLAEYATPEQYQKLKSLVNIQKRASGGEATISALLKSLNSSDLIFTLLNQVAGHPSRIDSLANGTAKLLKGVNISSAGSSLSGLTKSINGTLLLKQVEDSDLITSILDGFLLDASYRPVLVNITYRLIDSNKGAIAYILDTAFAPPKQKRADTSGGLASLASNLLGSVLSSGVVSSAIGDTLNALNSTGTLVYWLKRAVADPSYQDLAVQFVDDLSSDGAFSNLDLSSLNLTGKLEAALGNPSTVTQLIQSVVSGGGSTLSSLESYAKRYTGALEALFNDLEATGIFSELNDYLYPSSSTGGLHTSTSTVIRKGVETSSASGSSSSNSKPTSTAKSSSSHGAAGISLMERSNTPIIKALVFLQSLVFGGALLFV